MPENTVIIAAGGTGGHLYPGIALACELRLKGLEPLFFVRANDLCKGILDKEGFKYVELPAMGFPRRLSFKLVRFPFVMINGFNTALSVIRKIKPRAVVGMGGYVSFPAVVCAKILGIPTLIHEQNALPGLTNRILSRLASTVAVSFESSKKYFPGSSAAVTGNPVRTDLFAASRSAAYEAFGLAEKKFTVLVFGGSQGAARLNRVVIDSYRFLKEKGVDLQFLIVTGPKDFEPLQKEHAESFPGKMIAYAHSIRDAYAAADLIICRAGATTVAELKILNKPAVLVPFPYATANHQEYNARALEKEGRVKVIKESKLDPRGLADIIAAEALSGKRENSLLLPGVFPQEAIAAEVLKLIV